MRKKKSFEKKVESRKLKLTLASLKERFCENQKWKKLNLGHSTRKKLEYFFSFEKEKKFRVLNLVFNPGSKCCLVKNVIRPS